MLRCKKVGEALDGATHYESLPFLKKLGVQIHVRLCRICGKFHRDIMIIQDGSKSYRDHEEHLGKNCCINRVRKDAMREALQKAAKGQNSGDSQNN